MVVEPLSRAVPRDCNTSDAEGRLGQHANVANALSHGLLCTMNPSYRGVNSGAKDPGTAAQTDDSDVTVNPSCSDSDTGTSINRSN